MSEYLTTREFEARMASTNAKIDRILDHLETDSAWSERTAERITALETNQAHAGRLAGRLAALVGAAISALVAGVFAVIGGR